MPKTHPPEVKAAVMAALLKGQSIEFVAKEYRIAPNTVRDWKRQLPLTASEEGKKTLERIGDLVTAYLQQALTTLRIQAEQFSDPQWIAKQDASEAAVLHGVLADKAVRILEAAEAAQPDPGPVASPPDPLAAIAPRSVGDCPPPGPDESLRDGT